MVMAMVRVRVRVRIGAIDKVPIEVNPLPLMRRLHHNNTPNPFILILTQALTLTSDATLSAYFANQSLPRDEWSLMMTSAISCLSKPPCRSLFAVLKNRWTSLWT